MKIKKILMMTMIIISMLLFTSCGVPKGELEVETPSTSLGSLGKLNENLYYDVNTKIIYYKFRGGYTGYMSPYYSENGKLCRYNQSTKEIEELIAE